ncbi:tail assembly protein [Salmonella enterica]|uniref:Tail assembly protein n=5 Tax=Salmonella enterica TaxID=28901 RepID=A0A7Z1SZQ7_SALET|nr:tail assembly protein [Salmonella enterica]EAA8828628.1 tail assembly protein [Salmonella enterica subsp. enterica serovar Javiana]EBH8382398.1 tail assembly protein [Salmonella enterica subsp. enterica serovar 4,5,12:b:-]EBQ5984849.1 tail assembly protein [Salmonella enterica subsp. houtenae serovar Houten]EBW6256533.1 tail assembly protein [Salmonella enterica subsp. enterica serovar Kentucky]ECB4486206.1 tail assembly protein [Salmonella enterica subsp. enterica serovar Java]ECE6850119.
MATPHTLDMATQGMARVCLYGDLQRFGRRFSLSIKTGAEAIYALTMQIPGFRQKMNDGWYQIRIAGQDVDETSVSARLHEPLPDGAIIHIVPRMAGAKSGGLFQVVLGAVAIGAAFFTGGASLAAWGAFSTGLFTAGVGMMLGGVAQMLTPQAKIPSSRQTDNGKQNTYFSSLDNLVAQGNALPVLYGEMLVGSRTISQEISTRDEGGGGQVVVIGREQ